MRGFINHCTTVAWIGIGSGCGVRLGGWAGGGGGLGRIPSGVFLNAQDGKYEIAYTNVFHKFEQIES